ncbi:MAG: peptidoglycan editing factor PgeF [Ignavibacteriaceae bacterium]|nr:peptidoglycan editing factor PgeF [Ignavibacteriaceae bacterium]
MVVLKSCILSGFPEITFGFTTKIGLNREAPYFFNMSLTGLDKKEIVIENRTAFFNYMGLNYDEVVLQRQIHSDIITYINKGGAVGESDALITDKFNIGLAVSSADCLPAFIYDKKNKVIAGVHSGWKGTQKKILQKTLAKLFNEFNSSPENLIVYLGPSISQKNYEVGEEVTIGFDSKYYIPKGEKFLLDVAAVNYDMLIEAGVPERNIEKSNLCTYDMKDFLQSYRRDGINSGRALGVIILRDNYAR